MRAIILTIGDELIGGHTLDTNSSYLAGRLGELGISVARLETVGDDPDEIARQAGIAIEEADLVLVTGGLGPTADDITKEGVARATGRKLVVDPGLRAQLEARFKGHPSATPDVVESLARVPEDCEILQNRVGAAAGLAIETGGKHIFVMPGVPREMEDVFTHCVLPALQGLPRREVKVTRVLKTTGMSESAIAEKLKPVREKIEAGLGYLPMPGGVELRLTASGPEGKVRLMLSEGIDIIACALGDRLYSTEGEDLHFVVGRMLLERGRTLAVAESCTGGLIGHLLTEVPGISAVLDRSVVAYSNSAKIDSLNVPAELIERHGAVSPEVAEAMARGVKDRAGTDIGLSTTGIAGPDGGTEEKPVGLVYFGLALAAGAETHRMVFRGSREIVKLKAAVFGLDLLRCRLPAADRKPG